MSSEDVRLRPPPRVRVTGACLEDGGAGGALALRIGATADSTLGPGGRLRVERWGDEKPGGGVVAADAHEHEHLGAQVIQGTRLFFLSILRSFSLSVFHCKVGLLIHPS